eukprot:3414448-Alexandrium_andersonii.AAC.1
MPTSGTAAVARRPPIDVVARNASRGVFRCLKELEMHTRTRACIHARMRAWACALGRACEGTSTQARDRANMCPRGMCISVWSFAFAPR